VSAFAGSNEQVYTPEVPNIESEPTTTGSHPAHHSSPNTGKSETGRATGSNAETGGTGSEAENEGGSSEGHKSKEGSSSKEEEGNPSTGGGAGGNKPGGGSGAESNNGLSEGEAVGTAPKSTTGTHVSESSGSSSPVVPILIAVVVLAAISIGVVLYRQRKSGQGGSDGRVSSSNAS
jgi:cobalamin biosynthesis Mg chelatase CobN